ncbi:MAG: type II toxin-antitoxin system VapC family toxin [Opitutaceae bacterium]|jgi:hypothetical protein
MIFSDTSTLAKFYIVEPESPSVRKAFEKSGGIMLSQLARAELFGVFHRRMRERTWTKGEFQACVRQFQRDEADGLWNWVPVDTAILSAVCETFLVLPDTLFLRTADCIHLTTAINQGFDAIHTHDRHQSATAAHFGINPITLS